MTRGPDRYESLVIEYLELFEPGSRCHYEEEQDVSRCDLMWHRGSSKASVEVSAAANPILLRDWSARDQQGSAVPRSKARKRWFIHPRMGQSLKVLRSRLDTALAEYEAEVGDEVDRFPSWDCVDSPTAQTLSSMGVEYAWRSERSGDHFIHLSSGPSVTVRGEAVHDAAIAVAMKADNLKKLRQETNAERHMVVVVDWTHYEAYAPLTSVTPPPGKVVFPAEMSGAVTHLWALTTVNDVFIAWMVEDGGQWVQPAPLHRRR